MGGQVSKESSDSSKTQLQVRSAIFQPNTEGAKFETNPPSESNHFESIIPQLNLNTEQQSKNITKQKITVPNTTFDISSCFIIRNVLSKQECQIIIEASETNGFVSRKFRGDHTDSSSCVIWSEKLANLVFDRISNHLPNESYFDNSPGMTLEEYNSTKDGLKINYYGKLDCINPHVRVERYYKSQSLKVHRDGCVLVKNKRDEHVYTVYAVLIYLNNEFEGGNTEFVVNREINGNKMYNFKGIKGNIGDALVFRHEILHKGGKITDGKKYVLRMDAAYKLITDTE